jgi:hypothetical protein
VILIVNIVPLIMDFIPSMESELFVGKGQDWCRYELDSEAKMNHLDNTIVLYYEDLKEDMVAQLKKLTVFLGKQYSDDFYKEVVAMTNLAYVKKNKNITFGAALYRKGEIGDWKNNFTVAQNHRFYSIVEQR